MSGIGDRKRLSEQSVDLRYEYMREVAQSRAIISMGVSCFKKVPNTGQDSSLGDQETTRTNHYTVQNFNLTILCSEQYIVEPRSLSFLIDHGFDFNQQYSKGIPYTPGLHEDKKNKDNSYSLRELFSTIISSKKPVVLHNGLIDLIFMYQSFYTNLPKSLSTFVSDLTEIFSAGISDTKYLSEYHLRESASFLEYIFKKSQQHNAEYSNAGLPCVLVESPSAFIKSPCSMLIQCSLPSNETKDLLLLENPCITYGSHGHCPRRKTCQLSHNIEVVLAHEGKIKEKKQKKRKRKRKHASDDKGNDTTIPDCTKVDLATNNDGEDPMDSCETPPISHNPTELKVTLTTTTDQSLLPRTNGHRAGFDAFMTGFCFAMSKLRLEDKSSDFKLLSNKISLGGKDIPLHIMKSQFAKTSENHKLAFQRINGMV